VAGGLAQLIDNSMWAMWVLRPEYEDATKAMDVKSTIKAD